MVECCMAESRRLHSDSRNAVTCLPGRTALSCLASRAVPASCNESWKMSCTVQTGRCTRVHCRLAAKQPGGRFFSSSLLLISAILAVFPDCGRAQDLFESSHRPWVPTGEGDGSLLDRLWALISKSHAEEAEAADSMPLDMDSKLRGRVQRWWPNESRADDTSWNQSSASLRSLVSGDTTKSSSIMKAAASDDTKKSSLITKITFFGSLGEGEDSSVEERRKQALQWFFVVIGKSMGTRHSAPGETTEVEIRRFGDDPPEADFSVTKPFEADPTAPGGPDKDKRSPMMRSHFTLTFKQMPTKTAEQLAENFCRDYQDHRDILLQGFLRALENSGLYAEEGFKAATNLGTSLSSFIHLQVRVVVDNHAKTIAYQCDDQQAKSSTDKGALFLPDCPPNSGRCSEYPQLCSEGDKAWECKSFFGYDNNLKLKAQGEGQEVQERFHWNGDLDKKHGYCPPTFQSDDKEITMEHEDGGTALGVVGEIAHPRCENGFFNTGNAECTATSREEGKWAPDRWCKFEAPRAPPSLDCEEPDSADESRVALNCKHCRAVEKEEWIPETTSCQCTVNCAQGHKEVSGVAQGAKKCQDVDFLPKCPQRDQLIWNEMEPDGRRCRSKVDMVLTKDFCCKEAWGPSFPEELQLTDSCISLGNEKDCLTHKQADSGAPCCWNQNNYREEIKCAALGDGTLITADSRPQACAVRLRVPDAQWEDLPKCVKKCDDIYSQQMSLEVSGCDNCVPGEPEDKCACDVRCKSDLIWVGGGPEGSRTCSDTTSSFDQPPPVCQLPESVQTCDNPPPSSKHFFSGCEACLAGADGEQCPCQVTCASGFKRVGDQDEGQKLCHSKETKLVPKKCSDVTDKMQCFGAQSSEPLPVGMQRAPCCWRSDGFTDDNVKCLPMGSPLMSIQKAPQFCANQLEAEWDSFPECEMKCVNIFAGALHVVETSPGACDDCVAGDPEACTCNVECEEGSFYVGGGQVGTRKCNAPAEGASHPSFGHPPICMVPQDPSQSFMSGTSEVKSTCESLLWGHNAFRITGCMNCKAGDTVEACPCHVECADGHKRIGEVESGDKTCKEVQNELAGADCSIIADEQDCLRSQQSYGHEDGQPCCWNQDTFRLSSDGPQCAARGSPDIEVAPELCASTRKGEWEELPSCVKKCPNIFEDFANIVHSGCDDCVPNEDCPCTVTCADDPQRPGERLMRVGGGPEDVDGGTRQCPGDLRFAEPPICKKPRDMRQAEPRCAPPMQLSVDGALLAESVSLTSCEGCTAGDEECKCEVKCATGYKQTPDSMKNGDQQGPKKCNLIPAALDAGKACIQHKDDQSCLGSKDQASEKPCCWRSSGFLRNGKIDVNLKCAPIGEGQYIGFVDGKWATPPEKCAPIHSYKWDDMPKCNALCNNHFKGLPLLVVADSCDECFSDHPINEDCQCEVTCEPTVSKFFAGKGKQGRQMCGTEDDPRSFGEAPQCLAAEEHQAAIPDCVAPQDHKLEFDDCTKCKATEDDTKCDSCDVRCRDGYKAVGGTEEGPQICKQGIFQCPRLVEYSPGDNTEAAKCTDKATGKATNAWCCGEAHFVPETYPSPENCNTINDEETCFKRMDHATGKQCCWRKAGYKNGNQCAADESGEIDDEHIPDGCANRPPVPSAEWKDLPKCEQECRNPFASQYDDPLQGSVLNHTGCGDCVASQPQDCKCDVRCESEFVWVGGGKEGPRTCDPDIGLGKRPVCALPDRPVCDEPIVEHAIISNCLDCAVGGGWWESCKCTVQCKPGSKDVSGLETSLRKCSKPKKKSLKQKTCIDIPDRASCLESQDPGGNVCCWRTDGFSRTEVGGGHKCMQKESEDIELAPDQCAVAEFGEWDAMPQCKLKCENVFAQVSSLTTTAGCDDCLAGEPCPDCKVDCRPDLVHGGGSQPGSWTCTEENPQFSDRPICWEKEKAPLCKPPANHEGSLEVRGCSQCTAGQSCSDCTVACAAPRYLQASENPAPGKKQCHWVDVTSNTDDKPCNQIKDETECLSAKERNAPCCYHAVGFDDSGDIVCARRGDPIIKVVSGQCTKMKVEKWDDMPVCKRICEHMFLSAPHLDWEPSKCSDVCWQGGQCECEVHCKDGFDHIGGGDPGPRSCKDDYKMEDPPVCWKRPKPPVCEASTIPQWLKATNCENCVAGQDCPSCEVGCKDKFQHVSGILGNKKCQLSVNGDLRQVDDCEVIDDQGDCTRSYQAAGGNSDFMPCCWRGGGFHTNSVLCTATHSKNLVASKVPDQCTIMHKASWEPMPTCTQECPNIFDGLENIDHKDCDNCIPGLSCLCTVQCVKYTHPVPGSGEPGERLCQAGELEPFFEELKCSPKCEVPDDRDGTLNIAGCKSECFPGEQCNCVITCADKNERSGGGREGPISCTQMSPILAMFEPHKMPNCNPVCEPPGDQFQMMDVTRCQNRCEAGDDSCACEVSCKSKPADDSEAAKEGKKVCALVPGDQNTPARAVWANPSGTTGYDDLPNCMQAIDVSILDARNQKGVPSAMVKVYNEDDREQDAIEETTDDEGKVTVHTKLDSLYFVVTAEGYSMHEEVVDRIKQCEMPGQCVLRFAINKKLQSGDIHKNGCYFTAKQGEERIEMRAILSWKARPLDLDIWVRNVDCAEDARLRYQCLDKTDEDYSFAMEDDCARAKFRETQTKDLESQVCRQKKCDEEEGEGMPASTVMTEDGKHPVCPADFPNQFPKWVYWGARYVGAMAHRITGDKKDPTTWKVEKNPEIKYWTDDSYMFLNTDQKEGFGPETVTLHNAPPGTYQIAVDLFNDVASADEAIEDIKEGRPQIDLTIGGNDVVVKCQISEACRFESAVWNALNIKVEKMGKKTPEGEEKYSIRIIDNKREMEKLHPYNLPTSSKEDDDAIRYTWDTGMVAESWPVLEKYFTTEVEKYTTDELANVCHGTCRLSEDSEEFKDCLQSNH